jgi:hypothetical protein
MLVYMTNPNLSESASEARRPKLSSGPRQYVDVNDLQTLLKLGLGLHTLGDATQRWHKAADGMARLTNADACVAMMLHARARDDWAISPTLVSGKDSALAYAAVTRVESDCRKRGTPIARLLTTPKRPPGRVLAVIEPPTTPSRQNAVHSLLWPETTGRDSSPITWISILRHADAAPFAERERRVLELFHSQSAWLLLQLDL